MDIQNPLKPEIEAGVIAIREGEELDEVLIIKRNEIKDITIPKGHLENGESLQETAARETLEETGYAIQLKSYVDAFEYTVPSSDKTYIRRVYCFLAETEAEQKEITATVEVKGAEWLPIDEAIEQVSYPEVKVLIKKAYKKYLSLM